VYRGTIPAEKVNGQYTVLASVARSLAPLASDAGETTGETVLGHESDTGETPTVMTVDYIASMKDEIAFLRDQLDHSRRELSAERERFDVIHREALQRIEALTGGPVDVSDDDTAQDQRRASTMAQDATQPPESTSDTFDEPSIVTGWLRRLFGRS
jgi:hypothetical protein